MRFIKGFVMAVTFATADMGTIFASAAPAADSELATRQSTFLPAGQGALHLLTPEGEAVGCIEYHGLIIADPTSPICWQHFQADETSDDASAAFADEAGPCTFYLFSDGLSNYTCEGRSIAKDYFGSTFQEFPNGTLINTYYDRIYVYAYSLTNYETLSNETRPVKLMMSFVQ